MFQKLLNYARKLFGASGEKNKPSIPAKPERKDIVPLTTTDSQTTSSNKDNSSPKTTAVNSEKIALSSNNYNSSQENKPSQRMSLSEVITSSQNIERTQGKINHFKTFFDQGNRSSTELLAIMNEFSSEVDKVTITSWFSGVASNFVDKKDLPEILKPLGDGNKSIALYNLATVKGLGIDRNENFPLLDTDDKKAIAKLFGDRDFGIDTLKRIKQPLLEPIEAEISSNATLPKNTLPSKPEITSPLTKSPATPEQEKTDEGFSETPLRRVLSTTSLDSALSVVDSNSRAASPEPTLVAPKESLSATTNEVDYAALSERISRETNAKTLASSVKNYLDRNGYETDSKFTEESQKYLLGSSLNSNKIGALHSGLFMGGKGYSKESEDLSGFLPGKADQNLNEKHTKLAELNQKSPTNPINEAIKKLLYSQIEKSLDKVTATPESNTPSSSPASIEFKKLAPEQQKVTTV